MSLPGWTPPIAIAHRGSRTLWPENTMHAFSAAVDLGIRHLETDLRVTADGVVVCFHDATLDRTTSGSGPIATATWEQVRSLDAGFRHRLEGGFPYRGMGITVPTLEEVAGGLPEVALVVDLKADGVVGPLADLVDRLGLEERLIVGSFSDRRIAEFRFLTGGVVPTSTGSWESRAWYLASRVGWPGPVGARALQLPVWSDGIPVVDERLVTTAHRHGLQVHAWTVNDPLEMETLLGIGVDGIITDRPDLLRGILP